MRRTLLLLLVFWATVSYAQNINYTIESTFQPLSMEEMMMAARANAYRQEVMKQRFDEYQDKAYNCYNKGDFNGFIFYSDYALNTGWYNSKLYYDRGAAFERLHDYRKAKKEYKKAIKKGYYPAQAAYEQCKLHQKEWKNHIKIVKKMGIKSLFGSLFGHSDNQMPSSLGHAKDPEPNTINLGANIHQDQEDSVNNAEEQEPKKEDTSEAKVIEKEKTVPASSTYNLIILDESGSMSDVRHQTISGCNETLNSIRNTAKEQPEIKQFVSIFCFDNTNSRYIFQNVPIEDTRDLTTADYCPNSCTPLYDAIGYTVTQLQKLILDTDSVAVVTIITDGYENASRRWNHHSVVELIEGLKKKGWVFTFIGANIDVEQTARGLGINSFVEFEQSDLGMREMFEQERRSRRAYSEKRRYMSSLLNFASMPDEDRDELLGAMNYNYFVDKERVSPNFIKKLEDNEVFVFGSNILGQHSGGAALYAKEHFGAIEGTPEGIQGKSYAIPTHGNTFQELEEAVKRFTEFVVMHPQNNFMLTAVGCGTAGYSVEQVAPLFRQAYSFGNVYVPAGFLPFMPKNPNV